MLLTKQFNRINFGPHFIPIALMLFCVRINICVDSFAKYNEYLMENLATAVNILRTFCKPNTVHGDFR